MRIGFLGPEGTFCEEAGKIYIRGLQNTAELVPYATIHDLLFAVGQGKVKEGITPIENSIEGTVTVVTDTLVKDVNLKIKKELVLPIYHYLIGHRKVKLSDITDVVSHPQALEQCKGFLRGKLPKVKLHLSYSTAEAVCQVASSLTPQKVFAAIGSQASAKMYGLKILAVKINAALNCTRFVVLSKSDAKRTGRDKTSIVFAALKDVPGSLHDILGEFAIKNINLTKIESRPAKKTLGDYYFFIDMEGHRTDAEVKDALFAIRRKCAFLKILGSYPKAKKEV